MQGAIPKDIPLRLPHGTREENSRKRFSYSKTFCNICKGRCIVGNKNNRGCRQVNMRYDKLQEK